MANAEFLGAGADTYLLHLLRIALFWQLEPVALFCNWAAHESHTTELAVLVARCICYNTKPPRHQVPELSF